jgi:hypothetical protein
MPISLVEGNSLLAVDVGATTTRAVLFDVVEGTYRFIAAGKAPSTADAPFKDIGLGVRDAIESIQSITGRIFLDAERRLIMPIRTEGSGVDSFAATLSAGPAIRTVIVGLLSDVSLESARRLAETTYSHIVERLDLADHRRPEEQIDALLRSRPDLVVLTGGTDGGASRSVQKMLDTVGLACYLMPPDKRPAVLFAGNNSLSEDVKNLIGDLTPTLHISPNVRPSLETEDLDPAMNELTLIFAALRKAQVRGVDELETWSSGHLLSTAYATGRMIRFLSSGASGGVLAVNLGTSSTLVAAGMNGELSLHSYPQFGLGGNLPALLNTVDIGNFERWLSLDIQQDALRDTLQQRSLHPSTLPATPEDRVILQAIARQVINMAVRTARRDFPSAARVLRSDLLPFFELILASGAALTENPTPGQNMLLLLDAIQPVGVTRFLLDRNGLLPMMGAAAGQNSLLPVQVIESGAFHDLGWTVSVVSNTPYGTPVLQVRLVTEDKHEATAEVNHGSLEVLPLALGETARLTLQPMQRANIGYGPGRAKTMTVAGGPLGLVIDARGRPLQLPSDAARRRELYKKWLGALGD